MDSSRSLPGPIEAVATYRGEASLAAFAIVRRITEEGAVNTLCLPILSQEISRGAEIGSSAGDVLRGKVFASNPGVSDYYIEKYVTPSSGREFRRLKREYVSQDLARHLISLYGISCKRPSNE